MTNDLLTRVFQSSSDFKDGFVSLWVCVAGMPRFRCGYHFNTKRQTEKTGTGDKEAIPGGLERYDDITRDRVNQTKNGTKKGASTTKRNDSNSETSSELALLNVGYPRKSPAGKPPISMPHVSITLSLNYQSKTQTEQLGLDRGNNYVVNTNKPVTDEIVGGLRFLPRVNELLQKLLPAGTRKGPYSRFFVANQPLSYPPATVTS